MKVLLINPPYTRGNTWGDFKSVGAYTPPLGLCYLAAVLRKKNIDVKIIDAYVLRYTINQIIKILKEYSPDIIGITSVSILFEDTKKLAKSIKAELDLPVIIGGPHVTIFPEDTMKCLYFDFGVIGEGEETIDEIIQYLEGERSIESIKGIIYRKDGLLVRNNNRGLIMDLDKLPLPTIDLLPSINNYSPLAFTYRKKPVGYVLTSRGCPFSCIYCIRIMGKKFRTHSPERILCEIERLLYEFDVKEIHFSDDCFTVDAKRVNKICDLILEKGLKFSWKCSTHVNSLDYELLKKMKNAGCWYIGIGVETGDPRMMKFIRKNIDFEHLIKVIQWADSLGIAVKGFFILGFPSETWESLKNTIQFSQKYPFFSVSYNIAYLNPGSEMDRIADDFGIAERGSCKATAYSNSLSFIPHGFTAKDLKIIQRDAYLGFYLRPTQLLKMLKRNKNIENYYRSLWALLSLMQRIAKEKIRGFIKT